ncbi:uncharacterized protein [Solanum lycopersicum]|uniref:uncharacterized protein n=1 Tax=Solanum lycopersicum TaxID=4081 RepID=UPI003748C175
MGIELDPSSIKAIKELPPPKTKKELMSFIGRLNYISRFIAQSTVVCEPILKQLKKDTMTKWTEECKTTFDAIKNYLSYQPVLVPLQNGSPLLLYFSISDNAFGCVLEGEKAQALADQLMENPVDEEYESLKTYLPDEEVSFVGEDIYEAYPGWRLFFDGVANHQGKACIIGLKMAIDMNVHELLVIGDSDLLIHQVQDTDYIDALDIEIKEQPIYYSHVEAEPNGLPWYFDIKKYLESGSYPENETFNQKKSIRRIAINFFLSVEMLYRRTPDLGILKYINVVVAAKIINKYIFEFFLEAWISLVQKPAASNRYKFILVAIYYLFKRVEIASYNSVTKKVVANFVCNNLIYRFRVPDFIITNSGANLNSHLMRDICEQFKINHENSTVYRPQMNGDVEAANKNIKNILRKMIDNHREAVIPAEVKILSLSIIQEAELSNAEWVSKRIDQLTYIDEKRMAAIFMVNYIDRE